MESEVAVATLQETQFICPECKEKYPERTVAYSNNAGLSAHRLHKHGVTGSTVGYGRNPKPPSQYERTEAGTYKCPECDLSDFPSALAAGRHRSKVHKYRNPDRMHKKAVVPPTKVAKAPEPPKASERDFPDIAAVYLYGRVEAEIQDYANRNGMNARAAVRKVANLLLESL